MTFVYYIEHENNNNISKYSWWEAFQMSRIRCRLHIGYLFVISRILIDNFVCEWFMLSAVDDIGCVLLFVRVSLSLSRDSRHINNILSHMISDKSNKAKTTIERKWLRFVPYHLEQIFFLLFPAYSHFGKQTTKCLSKCYVSCASRL